MPLPRSTIPRPFRRPLWPPPGIPARYTPEALARPLCRRCKGTGYTFTAKLCRCVRVAFATETVNCRDKWERLYLDALRFPENFPSRPVPQSSWGRRFVNVAPTVNLRHY